MHPDRFDAVVQRLGSLSIRRRTLGVLLGGALGLLGPAASDDSAAESGRCKPKCGECKKCKKGPCQNKNGEKRCKRGKCKPKADGTACSRDRVCQSGRCTVTAPFCTGKDICEVGNVTDFPCHQSGTDPCVCVVDAITGASVCVRSPFTNSGCKATDPCPAGEICVDATGGLCDGGTARCALPCPNPL